MKNSTVISILIFILVLVATATGIFYKTPGAPFQIMTAASRPPSRAAGCISMTRSAWYAKASSGM